MKLVTSLAHLLVAMRSVRWSTLRFLLAALHVTMVILLLSGMAGCEPAATAPRTVRTKASVQPANEHLEVALDYLERLDEFQEQQARVQTTYQLNRWIELQKTGTDWKPDELINRVPKMARDRGALDELARRSFNLDDIRFLQETIWMRQLSDWVSQQALPPHFDEWLQAKSAELGAREMEQLGIAYRLFDWTIRNIQLEELPPNPDEAATAPAATTAANQPNQPASVRGIPGPGYQFEPGQVLIYGRGDPWQRMRVFTLLARQQKLDVVVLAFPGRTIPPRPRPWVAALLLKGQLYLFDVKLGIPLPGPGFTGVATLEQVLNDPALLTSLSIDEKHPYGVEKNDLAELAALIDVVSPNLSHRMQILETQLIGEHHTALSVNLSQLTKRLRECRGIYDVYVWSIPFEAVWFRTAYEKQLRDDEQKRMQHMFKFGMFADHTPLMQARYSYFRKDIESETSEQGAKALLMEARVSQEQLKQLSTDEQVQREFGLVRGDNEPDVVWQAKLESVKGMMTVTKQHASFWLGLLQLEAGRPESAIEWLKTRSLDVWPTGVWSASARYNLARAYEQQGAFDKAQQLLLADKSPQEHGNYLRAKMLQKQLEK